ncbi:hypothetical protein AMTRI_Chr05g57070 [Amborella trichopoda]
MPVELKVVGILGPILLPIFIGMTLKWGLITPAHEQSPVEFKIFYCSYVLCNTQLFLAMALRLSFYIYVPNLDTNNPLFRAMGSSILVNFVVVATMIGVFSHYKSIL